MQLGKSDPRSRITSEGTERAVSPVIGVILMVAITVVLAGVIGVMVFGLADDLGDSPPQASIEFANSTGELEISHSSGDTLDFEGDDYSLLVDGNEDEAGTGNLTDESNISTGETITISIGDQDETVEVALRHEGSDSLIGEQEVDFSE